MSASIISKRTISAIVCSLSLAAIAATPVAVWDGDFSPSERTKFSGYTLVDYNLTHGGVEHEQGASNVDYSSVTIDRNNFGLLFNAGSAMPGVTVLVRYSGLANSSSASRVLFTSCVESSHSYDRTGIQLKTDGKLVGLWNDQTSSNNNADNGTASGSIAAGGVMAFTYNTTGTFLYYGANCEAISATAAWGSTGLKSSNDSSIYGAAIGGMYKSKSSAEAAKGMTIEALAVFNRVLTVDEMNAYLWPSETQTINVSSDTTVSAINAQYDSDNYKAAAVSVADGVTITVDEAFGEKINSVSSTGSITLSAASQPDASYLANVDFSGVQGGLLRSWLTPGVVGVNFAKNYGNATASELVTSDSWVETTGASGNSTALFTDGLTKITWSASNDYSYNSRNNTEADPFIYGYLDDGRNSGNGVEITIENVPYATYDVVIYVSTDTSGARFQPKTVNGTVYTVDADGIVSTGNAVWGASRLAVPDYGQNAMRVRNLSGPLTIYGGLNTHSSGGGRGGIAAIQIMPTTAEDNVKEYTLSLDGTATNWSTGAWKVGTESVAAPLSGYATINLSASTTLTIDETVALSKLTVQGEEDAVLTLVAGTGSLVANVSATVKGGVLKHGSASVLGATPKLYVEDGATFDMNGLSISGSTAVYIAGAGAGNWPWALTSSSGAGGAILGGLYLSANATIGGANELKVGQTQAGYYCYLQGFTLTKTGDGALTGTNMNTPGTGTIDVQGGAMSVNQWNNLNSGGGDTVLTLREGASFTQNSSSHQVSVNTLNLLGGVLNTPNPLYIKSSLAGAGETARLVLRDGASASLTGDLTVTATMTLGGNATFLKDAEATADVVVTPATLTASTGTITVGSGVTLNLGVNRPAATITVQEGGTLAARMQSASDVIALATSAQPASVILYDANGTAVSNPRISFSDGTLTIMPPVPTLEASGTVAFDTAANWIDSTMPGNVGDAIIVLSGDATITVSGTYSLGSLTITGSGVATFSGEGSVTAASINVQHGATLTRNATISATTGIGLDSGTVLRLDGVTESAVISGAGAVETYGAVVMAADNTMTGGITVKPGSALSTMVSGGYGEYSADWAYSAQRQVVVKDGGTVDINNIANADAAVALTIAGKGILSDGVYSGAVTYSGKTAITSGSRQISSMVLTGDAMIDLGKGWGLVHSGWQNARLGLNGHTLTVRGTGTFPVVNVNNVSGAATTGMLILDGSTLELSNSASNLAGVNVVAKGCATINVAMAPTAIGSLTIAPSASGTTATNWNLPADFVPVVNSSNIDPSALTVGQELTLFTAPEGTELDGAITANLGSRYTATVSGNTVKATVGSGVPRPFFHYTFDGSVDKSADARANFSVSGEATSMTYIGSRNGQAITVCRNAYTPYWDANSMSVSPLHAGEVTITTVAKMNETGVTLWGLGTTLNGNESIGLAATDESSLSVVAKNAAGTVSTIVTVSGISDLTTKWHWIAIVADANSTTLYVDNESATVAVGVSPLVGQQGQLGSFHSGSIVANKVGTDGYYLDDWRVYDAALTKKEVRALKRELCPDSFFIRLR